MNKNTFSKLNIGKFAKTHLNFKKTSVTGFIQKKINNFKVKSVEDQRLDAIRIIGWGMPIAFVPSLRYMQDKDKPKALRKELFVRDFASYSVGTALYALTIVASRKMVSLPKINKKLSENVSKLLPDVIAVSSFCIWSGIFGPKFSKKLQPKLKINKTTQPEIETIKQKNINFTRRLQSYKPITVNSKLYSDFKI